MIQENVERFFYWINERHRIYLSKAAGNPPPWTSDEILQKYKFTNAFRELDKTTVWMRENLTGPHSKEDPGLILFNCCVFRMFGTMEFSNELGFIWSWSPEIVKSMARERLDNGEKVFTGAYIITNQGLREPKEQVVVDYFLTPVWNDRDKLVTMMMKSNRLQIAHELLGQYKGWGGGGFMAYEVVTDLNHTSVLPHAQDQYHWANAGPGAKRGLNRIQGFPLDFMGRNRDWNSEMKNLLDLAPKYLIKEIPRDWADMRMIEHSLCEWDKYERVRLGQGKPRSLYRGTA
jgi:hypothetical protein